MVRLVNMNRDTLKAIIIAGLYVVPFIPFLVSGSFFFPFITTKAFTWRIIIEAIFAAWILLALLEPAYRPKKGWILYSLFIFIGIIGIADLFGEAPMKSFWSNAERMEGFVSLLHLGMYFLVASSVFAAYNWRRWWNISLIAAALMVVYCFFQLVGVFQINQGGVRVDGTFGNAAYLAVYMLIHIFIALYFLLKEERRSLRVTYGILAFLYAAILYYTATRGAILGLIGGLVVTSVLSLRGTIAPRVKRFAIGYLAVLVVGIGTFFALRSTDFVQNSLTLARFANLDMQALRGEGRAFVWPIAIEGIKEHPLLGWGQENFNYVFNSHYKPEMHRLEPWFDRAHNIFLDWGIAGGLLGLAAYLSLYVFLLYYIWRRDPDFTHVDKTVLTGLIAAYFFHNLFVFDHLVSYVLFVSLLAYVHSRSDRSHLWAEKTVSMYRVNTTAAPIVLVALLIVMYFVNIKPIGANTTLISALQKLQMPNPDYVEVIEEFEKAYGKSRLGRPEIVEQMASNAPRIFQSDISEDQKNRFYNFVRVAIEDQIQELPDDARYHIVAGTFLMEAGKYDEALTYLNRAKELIPGKQLVYYQIATTYINMGRNEQGLEMLRTAYELDMTNNNARIAYLIGAIYAGDRSLESSLIAELRSTNPDVLLDDRIASAYLAANRFQDLIAIFNEKLNRTPDDPQAYINLTAAYLKIGDKAGAISTLQRMSAALPQYKQNADTYIEQIRNGTIQ